MAAAAVRPCARQGEQGWRVRRHQTSYISENNMRTVILILFSLALVQGCTKCSSPQNCTGAELEEAMKCVATSTMARLNIGALGFADKQWSNNRYQYVFELNNAGKTDVRPETDVPEDFQGNVRQVLSYGLTEDLRTHMACLLWTYANDGIFGEPSSFKDSNAFEGTRCTSPLNNLLVACKDAGVAFETILAILQSVMVPDQSRIITDNLNMCKRGALQAVGDSVSWDELDQMLAPDTKSGALMMYNSCPSSTLRQECSIIFAHEWYDIYAGTLGTKYLERYEQAFSLNPDVSACIEGKAEFNSPRKTITYTGGTNSQGLCAFTEDAESVSLAAECDSGSSPTIVRWHGTTYKDRHGQANCGLELPTGDLCSFSTADSEQDFVKTFAKRLVNDFKTPDGAEMCVAELSTSSSRSCKLSDAYDFEVLTAIMQEEFTTAVERVDDPSAELDSSLVDNLDNIKDLAKDAVEEAKPFWEEYRWHLIGGGSGLLLLLCFCQQRFRILCCCRPKPDAQAKDPGAVSRYIFCA